MDNQEAKAAVMVVDDTPANLQLLEELLQGQGYRVVEFTDGAMALSAAARTPPDLILLDIMMPGMDGFEVCRRLKADETLKDIPVIFISALDDTINKVKAFSEGGVDYVTKPFQEEEVLARVKTHLNLRKVQLQIEAQKKEIEHNYSRLHELEEMRDNLVHMIVHDLRSTLMGIQGWLEVLKMKLEGPGNADLMKYVEKAFSLSRTLQEMISVVLDISRMESGKMPLEKMECDLRNVVSEALTSLGTLVKRTTIVYEAPENPVHAYCDPGIIQRVVANLVANAVKFTGRSGEVRIAMSKGENNVTVTVADTGPGIPAEYHELIFEKFGQVKNRQKGTQYSSGLGLAFCKLAVETHGGRIDVESEVGKGSTFRFTMPSIP